MQKPSLCEDNKCEIMRQVSKFDLNAINMATPASQYHLAETSVEIWANDLQTQSVFKKDLDQIPRILSTYKYNSADSAVIPISKTDTLAGGHEPQHQPLSTSQRESVT